jgi:hypothetical protein
MNKIVVVGSGVARDERYGSTSLKEVTDGKGPLRRN